MQYKEPVKYTLGHFRIDLWAWEALQSTNQHYSRITYSFREQFPIGENFGSQQLGDTGGC